ncbi:MAG: hypothetical protein ACREJV_14515 [Candidatus Rokuibacteriota bacterium]
MTYYITEPRATVEQCRRWAEVRVEALNHALRGIARDRVRFHTCDGRLWIRDLRRLRRDPPERGLG